MEVSGFLGQVSHWPSRARQLVQAVIGSGGWEVEQGANVTMENTGKLHLLECIMTSVSECVQNQSFPFCTTLHLPDYIQCSVDCSYRICELAPQYRLRLGDGNY